MAKTPRQTWRLWVARLRTTSLAITCIEHLGFALCTQIDTSHVYASVCLVSGTLCVEFLVLVPRAQHTSITHYTYTAHVFQMPLVASVCPLVFAISQEHRKSVEKDIQDANEFRQGHAAAREARAGAGDAGPGSSGGGGGGGDPSAAPITGGIDVRGPPPKDINVANARPWAPAVKGACLWHEKSTDRVRVCCARGARKSHWSHVRAADERLATMECLKWAWCTHEEFAGAESLRSRVAISLHIAH